MRLDLESITAEADLKCSRFSIGDEIKTETVRAISVCVCAIDLPTGRKICVNDGRPTVQLVLPARPEVDVLEQGPSPRAQTEADQGSVRSINQLSESVSNLDSQDAEWINAQRIKDN